MKYLYLLMIVALFGSCGSGEETEATGSNRGDFAYPSQWENQPICENIEGLLFNLRGAVRGVDGDVFLMDGKPYSGIIKECDDGLVDVYAEFENGLIKVHITWKRGMVSTYSTIENGVEIKRGYAINNLDARLVKDRLLYVMKFDADRDVISALEWGRNGKLKKEEVVTNKNYGNRRNVDGFKRYWHENGQLKSERYEE